MRPPHFRQRVKRSPIRLSLPLPGLSVRLARTRSLRGRLFGVAWAGTVGAGRGLRIGWAKHNLWKTVIKQPWPGSGPADLAGRERRNWRPPHTPGPVDMLGLAHAFLDAQDTARGAASRSPAVARGRPSFRETARSLESSGVPLVSFKQRRGH